MKAAAIKGTIKNFNPVSEGLQSVGVESKLFNHVNEALDWGCDFFIQTNIHSQWKEQNDLYQTIKNTQLPILVIESPVFRFFNDQHYKWYRLSWNSFLFPEAIYPWQETSNRWQQIKEEYNLSIKPWKNNNKSITVALQKFNDSSLNSLYSKNDHKPFPVYIKWLTSVVEQLIDQGVDQITLRPHPTNNETQIEKIIKAFPTCTVSKNNDLWLSSKCVVTFNSLFAIDSLYNGIPTISLSNTSLHSQFGTFSLTDIDNSDLMIDREYMFEKLSYCQWREDEVRSGVPFKKLLSLI